MNELSKVDQDVLKLLSEGVADLEVCRQLSMSRRAFADSVKRIEERALAVSDNAGRLYELALRKRAENINRSLNARFKAILEILPQAVIVVDGRSGAIKQFNQPACDLFGYSKEELGAMTVEVLVSEEHRGVHPALRLGFLANTRKRAMGYHPPIFGVRKNGEQVEMAIALTSTPGDDDVMVVCTERSSWTGDYPSHGIASGDIHNP